MIAFNLLLLAWFAWRTRTPRRRMRCISCGKVKELPQPTPPLPTGICRRCSEDWIVKAPEEIRPEHHERSVA